jgi:hypothetical protein
MCRFLVLRCVRRDHIDCLPIPMKVKNYLLEKQYYVETLEEDWKQRNSKEIFYV